MTTDEDITDDDDRFPDDSSFTRAVMEHLEPTIDTAFESLGLRTLRQVLDAGDLGVAVGRESLEFYCVTAALVWADDLSDPVENMRERLAGTYARFLFAVFVEGSENATLLDGEPAVQNLFVEGGDPILITAESLRHWQWLWTICSDQMSAARVLRQAPDDLRAIAQQRREEARA